MSSTIIIKQAVKEVGERFNHIFPDYRLPLKEQARISRIIRSEINNDKTYRSYSLQNKSIKQLIIAVKRSNIDEEGIILPVIYFKELPSQKNLIKEINGIWEHYPQINKIKIVVNSHSKPLINRLKKVGFKVGCYELVAKISETLEDLDLAKTDEAITTRRMIYKKDINDVMKISKSAHHHDETSTLQYTGPKIFNFMKNVYQQCCKEKTGWVAIKNKKIVGVVSTFSSTKIPVISSIAVSTKHQGKGVAKLLYQTALLDLRSKRKKYFIGYSSTTKVLRSAKKMKRYISTVHLEFDRKDWNY